MSDIDAPDHEVVEASGPVLPAFSASPGSAALSPAVVPVVPEVKTIEAHAADGKTAPHWFACAKAYAGWAQLQRVSLSDYEAAIHAVQNLECR